MKRWRELMKDMDRMREEAKKALTERKKAPRGLVFKYVQSPYMTYPRAEYIIEVWDKDDDNLVIAERKSWVDMESEEFIKHESVEKKMYTLDVDDIETIKKTINDSERVFDNKKLGTPPCMILDGAGEEIILRNANGKKKYYSCPNLTLEYFDSNPDSKEGELIKICRTISRIVAKCDETARFVENREPRYTPEKQRIANRGLAKRRTTNRKGRR